MNYLDFDFVFLGLNIVDALLGDSNNRYRLLDH